MSRRLKAEAPPSAPDQSPGSARAILAGQQETGDPAVDAIAALRGADVAESEAEGENKASFSDFLLNV